NPNFIGFINNFDGSGDGAVKKEILADSALTVLQKYITKPTDGAVARLNELSQRMKAGAAGQEGIASSGGVAGSLVSGQPVSSLLTYNRDTGLIQVTGVMPNRKPDKIAGTLGVTSRDIKGFKTEYEELQTITNNINKAVDTIYALREHNPETKDLTKQQIAQFLIEDGGLIDKSLVSVTGERKEIDF